MCRQAKGDESGEIFQPASGLFEGAFGSFAQVSGDDWFDAHACLAYFNNHGGARGYPEFVHFLTGHSHNPRVANFAQLRRKHDPMIPYIRDASVLCCV